MPTISIIGWGLPKLHRGDEDDDTKQTWLVAEMSGAMHPPSEFRGYLVARETRIDDSSCYLPRGLARRILREAARNGFAIRIPEEIDAVLPPRFVWSDGTWAPQWAPNLLELALLRSERRPNTIRTYMNAAHNFPIFAGRDPSRWTGFAVVQWREALKTMPLAHDPYSGKCLSLRSINTNLAALRYVSRRAFELKLIPEDFARAAELVSVIYAKKRHAVPLETAKRIVATCASDTDPFDVRDRALLMLGFYHGLRRESLTNLCLEDLNFLKSTMTVIIKGGRRHTLPLDPRCHHALGAWIRMLKRKFNVQEGRVMRGLVRHVAGVKLGRPIGASSVYALVRRRAASAGIRFHPHLMRHCFISWAVANGRSLEEIMLVTGHRSTAMIMEYLGDIRGLGELPQQLVPALDDE